MSYYIQQELTIIFLIISFLSFSQEKRTDPLVKQGSDALQRKALIDYNLACELVAAGNDSLAEIHLLKAISTSMTLVEAQRFLADIYVRQHRYEEALIYYNSAIDFYVDQEPHYYFHLFELALRFGEYSFGQHAMKHFKSRYGQRESRERYEVGYPYTPDDYEYHTASLRLVYDYLSWKGAFQLEKLPVEMGNDVTAMNEKQVLCSGSSPMKLRFKNGELRSTRKARKIPLNMEYPMISSDGKWLLYGKITDGHADICYRKKKGRTWGEEQTIPGQINSTSWEGHPWLSNDGTNLYFSSDRDGSKDLFVAKVNLDSNTCIELQKLDWINSYRDEISPSFNKDETVFYFASDGLPGFGGFDIFKCIEYERMNGIVAPQNPKNMKYPLNSQHDESAFMFLPGEQTALLLRTDIYGKQSSWRVRLLKPEHEVNFELPILYPDANQ